MDVLNTWYTPLLWVFFKLLLFITPFCRNPFYVQKKGLSCLGEYGGPVFPYVALGGVGDENYPNATALILTFMVQNNVDPEENADAIAWERKYVVTVILYSVDNLTLVQCIYVVDIFPPKIVLKHHRKYFQTKVW